MTMFDKLERISKALTNKYPKGNKPFQIMTRLAEEVGELAAQVNHFENKGSKTRKHGEPDKNELAKEMQDVIRSVIQLLQYYSVEEEFHKTIQKSYKELTEEGFIKE